MNIGYDRSNHSDLRMTIYRAVKQLLLIVLLCFIVKYALCDTVLIKTDQMAPAIQKGDRVLLSKIQFVAPLKWIFSPRRKKPIIFNLPHSTHKKGCLRIVGKPGDIVTIKQGVFSIVDKPEIVFSPKLAEEDILPAEYSPRDNMDLFHIPEKGNTIALDTLSIRDFIFLYSMIRQENPHKTYTFKPLLYIDDSLTNDYFIKDFSLFTGKFNAIPDTFVNDWLFWNRLEAYLVSSFENKKIDLRFSLLNNQSPVMHYKIKQSSYFLLSDDWCKGYDSRYFGPVSSTFMKGRVVAILWSFTPGVSGIRAFRGRRICKIVKNIM